VPRSPVPHRAMSTAAIIRRMIAIIGRRALMMDLKSRAEYDALLEAERAAGRPLPKSYPRGSGRA
jgi:hypothetical protein